MENYLLDGRYSLSNNTAENAIRPFTVGRKNRLFADTPKGASASAVVYSLVETAKANGLNVNKYLEYVLQFMSATAWRNNPEFLDEIMPWDAGVLIPPATFEPPVRTFGATIPALESRTFR